MEYLWFVGDFASYDPNDVRRVGEEGLFEMLVEQNLKEVEKAEFKTIVTTDPHSYNTLKNEYSEFGLDTPVYHYTEILADLLASGRLKPMHQNGAVITYHDPCYLGRYNGVTEAPRRILQALGVELREMPCCRENTFCCGAGGGRIWMDDSGTPERPSENRIREALALLDGQRNGHRPDDKPYLFVVVCPKDVVMYTDSVKTSGNEGRIEVRDIAQLVEEALNL